MNAKLERAKEAKERKAAALRERLAAVQKELQEVTAQERRLAAVRAAKEAERERKADNHRKILRGAALTAAMRDGRVPPEVLAIIESYVTKQADRIALGIEKPAGDDPFSMKL